MMRMVSPAPLWTLIRGYTLQSVQVETMETISASAATEGPNHGASGWTNGIYRKRRCELLPTRTKADWHKQTQVLIYISCGACNVRHLCRWGT